MSKVTKETEEQLIADMKAWQKVENAAIASTGAILEQTDNPVVRLVMEVIQRDCLTHHRTQQLIIDSTTGTITLTPEELGTIWKLIEKHIELEKKTIELGQKAMNTIQDSHMVVQKYLLEYLLEDEAKHSNLLYRLDAIKQKMGSYGPGG